MPVLELPFNGWHERPYQEPLWDYLMGGGKRAYAVWHRRAGKDDVALHFASCMMHERIGNVWHCLPMYEQGRKALWTAVNAHTGKRRIDEAFPEKLRENVNDNEMFIRMKCGSTWQIIGSDRYNATVGASPMAIVYSEWALANPSAWAYHRPMLQENNGVALFITTPRGRNHAMSMLKHAQQSDEWFAEVLTAKDTGALNDDQLAETLKEYESIYGHDMAQALWRQEYFCDFNAAVLGAFYAYEMAQVRAEGRVTPIEPPPNALVHRAWDIGIGDDTSVWKFSVVGSQIFIYSHHATSGVSVEWWRDKLAAEDAEQGWKAGSDWVPHDAKHREFGTGRTIIETMQTLGLKPMPVPSVSIDDGINAVRRTLPLCVFHPRCEEGGLSAIEQYRREWDDEKKAFRASAVHDWTSNPADALRYLALSWRKAVARAIEPPRRIGFVIPPPAERQKRGMRL
jgi:phage terminase large subunit